MEQLPVGVSTNGNCSIFNPLFTARILARQKLKFAFKFSDFMRKNGLKPALETATEIGVPQLLNSRRAKIYFGRVTPA